MKRMKGMKKTLAGALVLTMMLSGGSVCSANAESGGTETVAGPGTIAIETNSDLSNLAPSSVQNDAHFRCGNLMYEKLLGYDADGNIIPCLATEYSVSDDLKLTLKLRENVEFHTGGTMTAADVLFSLKLARDSANFSRNVKYMDLDAAEMPDDYTLIIPMEYKTVFLEDDLAKVEIASEKAYNEDPAHLNNKDGGTGPYYVSDWQVGSSVTFTKFDKYWGQDLGRQNVDEIVYKVISEGLQRAISLETNDVQVLYDVPKADVDSLLSNPDITVESMNTDGCFALYFNCSEGKTTSDVRIRQAIAYAIDTAALAQTVYGSTGVPATTIENRTNIEWDESFADDEPLYAFDVEKAKALLAEAGYPDGGLTMKLICDSTKEGAKDAIQIIQKQLADIGITVEVELQEPSVYTTAAWDPEAWDLLYDFYGTIRTSLAFINNQFDQRTGGRAFLVDEKLQTMLEDAVVEYDAEKIDAIMDYFTELVPAYPMVDLIRHYAYKKGIENFNIYPYNVMYPGEFTYTADYDK